MIVNCLTKNIKLKIENSIVYNLENLKFWLERFIPSVKILTDGKIDYTIKLKIGDTNDVIYNEKNSVLIGTFNDGFESYVAKYLQQVFAKLLFQDRYVLIPAACVKKGNQALLIVGDYWQGKTSLCLSLFETYNYDLISDNYVIIRDGKVIYGTNHISIRKENVKNLNKIKQKALLKRNDRYFYKIENNKETIPIAAIVTCHINEKDNNIHVVSKEESIWFLFNKFLRLFNGECLLFEGSIPSPIFNNAFIAKKMLIYVNEILLTCKLYYLSSSLNNIDKYINNKILTLGLDYNFAIKLTTFCPGNCKCCKNRKDNFKFKNINKITFDIGVYQKICEEIKKIGGEYVCLSGGEPTIVPNLVDYIRIAGDLGLNVRLNTSGYGITEEKLNSWIEAGLTQIVLSIYSLDRELTKITRGNELMYDRTFNAVKTIAKVRKSKDFVFIIQSVIMKDNYNEIAEIFKIALDNNADMYWPSYLEDAINLDTIRLSKKDIEDFRKNVIPRMIEYVKNKKKYQKTKNSIISDINEIYNKNYDNYIYHENNTNCPWCGRHFTFYPDGIIDPCPGHEYFKSDFQWHINYDNIKQFFTKENLEKNIFVQYDYCKFCPQGEHKAIRLNFNLKHEHAKKGEFDE